MSSMSDLGNLGRKKAMESIARASLSIGEESLVEGWNKEELL